MIKQRFLSPKEWLKIGIIFAAYRLIVGFFSWVAGSRLFLNSDSAYPWIPANPWRPELSEFWSRFIHWDSGWYLSIVVHGYYYTDQGTNVAFFPLYPLLMKLISFLGINPLISGLIISHLALFGACVFLYKLANLELGEKSGTRAIMLMLLFPFSFFFISVYTEALFLFLIVASFYFARKQKWLFASLLAMFASACRPVGILLIIPLLWEYFQQKNYKFKEIGRKILWLLLAPLGLISYMSYLGFKFGNPLLFVKAENIWSRSPSASLTNLWGVFKSYGYDFWQALSTGQSYFLANSFDLVIWIVFAILAIIALVKLRPAYGVLMLMLLFAGAITGTLISSTRFVIVLFPAYLVMAKFTKSETAFSLTLACFAIFLGLFAIMFTAGYWVG